MKSKLALLALTAALALSANAPNAMASPTISNHAIPRANAVSRAKVGVTKKVGPKARRVSPTANPGSHAK